MAASLAQGEVPCDLELAMGKYIYIYIYCYIHKYFHAHGYGGNIQAMEKIYTLLFII